MKDDKIVVVGLGYVGIPVACMLAKVGFNVVGIDLKKNIIEMINRGESPIKGNEPGLANLLKKVVATGKFSATSDYSVCKDTRAVIICVDTPIDPNTKEPNYSSLKSALESIGKNLGKGTLVVIESTIAPGTMGSVARSLLEENSGLRAGEDFYLANCPERVMPGTLLYNIVNMDRVIGGINIKSQKLALGLYKKIVRGKLYLSDCLTAEIVKTTENAYRDVQIAFANELARMCEVLGANVYKVRELVNKCPFRDMHVPGAGVGGHCVPKDPWLLHSSTKGKYNAKLLAIAREINDSMPYHMVELTKEAFSCAGKELRNSKICVLGLSYLPNSDDTRNSPTIPLIKELRNLGAKVVIHDPFALRNNELEASQDLDESVENADCVVIMILHDTYKKIKMRELKKAMRSSIIVDGRNLFKKEDCEKLGFIYKGIGK